MGARFVTVLALAAAAFPAAAAAAQPAALVKVKQLRHGQGVRTGHEMTPALAHLYAALPALSGDDRSEAETILARPDDSQQDAASTHKWQGPEAPGSPKCTTHFCVHWTNAPPDASNPTYAQDMANLFENEVYPCENGTGASACAGAPGLGWRDPAPDGALGGDGRVDIYVEDLFTNGRLFGYVAPDPGQPRDASVPHYAYMVMDKDYTRFGDGSAASGLAAERVTAAHEYNHVLQDAYDYLEDSWMFEATAVYMEEKVYPGVNDYLRYVNEWVANPKQPLTAFPDANLKAYGSAVWNHWLEHRFGAGAVRSAWEQSVAAADFAPSAYAAAIARAGGPGFADEFDRFAAAVAEWDVPGGGFPDTYPDVARDASLPVETQTTPFALPHTTFAFFDVPIPAGSPPRIRLTATLPTGTAGAVALVGRTGLAPTGGDVTTNLTPMPAGGLAAANLDNPAQYGRITAIVVNSDPSRGGFDSTADDYIFTRDAADVTVAMAAPGPPIPTTGIAGSIRDHGASVNGSIDPHLLDTKWSIEYGRSVAYGTRTKPALLPADTVGAAPVVVPLRSLKANATYHYRVLATNSAGVTAGRDVAFKTARDVTPPTVRIKVKRQPLAGVRRHGARYRLRCSERCAGRAELRLPRGAARRAQLPVVVARSRASAAAGKTRSLHVRLTPRARRALLGRTRALRLTLVVSVADDSRNRRVRRATVRVSP